VEAGGAESLTGCIGSVEQVRGYIRSMEDAGVDEIIFVMQAGNNRHDHICESMELFAAEVMPEFTESRPARPNGSPRRCSASASSARSTSTLPSATTRSWPSRTEQRRRPVAGPCRRGGPGAREAPGPSPNLGGGLPRMSS
jgi:hypothetical protein